jgi:hypothetical protein
MGWSVDDDQGEGAPTAGSGFGDESRADAHAGSNSYQGAFEEHGAKVRHNAGQ